MLDLVEIFKIMDAEDRAREGMRHGVHYDAFIAAIEGHSDYEIVDEKSGYTDTWYNYGIHILLCEGQHYMVALEFENEGNRVLVEQVDKVYPEEYTAINWVTRE